jgi:hypothetical protein
MLPCRTSLGLKGLPDDPPIEPYKKKGEETTVFDEIEPFSPQLLENSSDDANQNSSTKQKEEEGKRKRMNVQLFVQVSKLRFLFVLGC